MYQECLLYLLDTDLSGSVVLHVYVLDMYAYLHCCPLLLVAVGARNFGPPRRDFTFNPGERTKSNKLLVATSSDILCNVQFIYSSTRDSLISFVLVTWGGWWLGP